MPPSIAQQKGLAFAPISFAAISFFSSCYVIYYLICTERKKLQRLYHRLILAMNVALLPLSFAKVWGIFAVPNGTSNVIAASGTINTCTAQGYLSLMFGLTVPTYYCSLSLQAFMGIKYNFKEEKYQWIEKFIHLVAWCYPAVLAAIVAATENFNPYGSGCFFAKAPEGCEGDPDVPCERGGDIDMMKYITGGVTIFLYFVFPPSTIIAMYCWILKIQKKVDRSCGMQQIREKARKAMMRQIGTQVSLYLFSFWSVITPTLIAMAYQLLTKRFWYNLQIFADCVQALQGFVMTVVYFTLERLGTPKPEGILPSRARNVRESFTVASIRARAQTESTSNGEVPNDTRESFTFNIFDGVPDEDSPWAKFFDQNDDNSNYGGG